MSPKPERVGEGIFNLQDELAAEEALNRGLAIISQAVAMCHQGQNQAITGILADCHEGKWCIHPVVRYKDEYDQSVIYVALGGLSFKKEYPVYYSIGNETENSAAVVSWKGSARNVTYTYSDIDPMNFTGLFFHKEPHYYPVNPEMMTAELIGISLFRRKGSSDRRKTAQLFVDAINNAGGLSSETPAESSGDKTFSDMSPQERRDCEREITQSDAI